jgi:ABC-type transport system involved in multi-copper enzyme maturation permease subunit
MVANMTTWRSKFWNIVLAIIMFGMLLCSVAAAFAGVGGSYLVPTLAIAVPLAIVFLVGFVRSFMLGVVAGPEGVTARLLLRTVKIRWSEVETIAANGSSGGAIVWKRADKTRTTELNVLGSYDLLGRETTLGQRATADLNARLKKWRKEQAVSGQASQ